MNELQLISQSLPDQSLAPYISTFGLKTYPVEKVKRVTFQVFQALEKLFGTSVTKIDFTCYGKLIPESVLSLAQREGFTMNPPLTQDGCQVNVYTLKVTFVFQKMVFLSFNIDTGMIITRMEQAHATASHFSEIDKIATVVQKRVTHSDVALVSILHKMQELAARDDPLYRAILDDTEINPSPLDIGPLTALLDPFLHFEPVIGQQRRMTAYTYALDYTLIDLKKKGILTHVETARAQYPKRNAKQLMQKAGVRTLSSNNPGTSYFFQTKESGHTYCITVNESFLQLLWPEKLCKDDEAVYDEAVARFKGDTAAR